MRLFSLPKRTVKQENFKIFRNLTLTVFQSSLLYYKVILGGINKPCRPRGGRGFQKVHESPKWEGMLIDKDIQYYSTYMGFKKWSTWFMDAPF